MSTLLTYFDRKRHGESSAIFCAGAGDFANTIGESLHEVLSGHRGHYAKATGQ